MHAGHISTCSGSVSERGGWELLEQQCLTALEKEVCSSQVFVDASGHSIMKGLHRMDMEVKSDS